MSRFIETGDGAVIHPSTAIITYDGPGPKPGTHKLITKLGTQVVHHVLTETEYHAALADPTLAHRREWAAGCLHASRRFS